MYLVTLRSMAARSRGFAEGTPATDGFVVGITSGESTVSDGKAAAWASTLHATVGLTV